MNVIKREQRTAEAEAMEWLADTTSDGRAVTLTKSGNLDRVIVHRLGWHLLDPTSDDMSAGNWDGISNAILILARSEVEQEGLDGLQPGRVKDNPIMHRVQEMLNSGLSISIYREGSKVHVCLYEMKEGEDGRVRRLDRAEASESNARVALKKLFANLPEGMGR